MSDSRSDDSYAPWTYTAGNGTQVRLRRPTNQNQSKDQRNNEIIETTQQRQTLTLNSYRNNSDGGRARFSEDVSQSRTRNQNAPWTYTPDNSGNVGLRRRAD